MDLSNLDQFVRYQYGSIEGLCDYYEEKYVGEMIAVNGCTAYFTCVRNDRAGYPVLEFSAHVDRKGCSFIFPIIKAGMQTPGLRASLREVLKYPLVLLHSLHRKDLLDRCISKRRVVFDFLLSPDALKDRVSFLELLCTSNDHAYSGISFMSALYRHVYRDVERSLRVREQRDSSK